MSEAAWQTLGRVAPDALGDARLQLHHAAQLVAAVGQALLEPQPDDGHPNFGWCVAERALAGHRVPAARPFRAALRPEGLALLLLEAEGGVADALPLAGETLAGARAWLERAVAGRCDGAPPRLAPSGYEIPHHPVADGAPFGLEPAEAFAELARWFANADAALRDVLRPTQGASAVRCWPHHFDLASLVTLATGADGSATKTVGLGLSPGDDAYPEPYAYVAPWPYPAGGTPLPALSAGHWHREGFTAAVLTGSELVARGSDAQQPERLRGFLEAAFAASRALHGL